jgi:ATP-dependent Lon protease
MTGEVTLRGKVLPIGGLKEKLLAAKRGEIRTVIIPEENHKDMKEVPEEIRKGLEVILVNHMDQVLEIALVGWKFKSHSESSPPKVYSTLEDRPVIS